MTISIATFGRSGIIVETQQLVYDRVVIGDRPNRPRWQGDYIRWWGGADWEWIACVKCQRPLTDPKAMRDGFGRECAGDVTAAMIESIKHAEHDACQIALDVHTRAQTTTSPWWTHQAYLKRQFGRRRSR